MYSKVSHTRFIDKHTKLANRQRIDSCFEQADVATDDWLNAVHSESGYRDFVSPVEALLTITGRERHWIGQRHPDFKVPQPFTFST